MPEAHGVEEEGMRTGVEVEFGRRRRERNRRKVMAVGNMVCKVRLE